MVLIKNKSKISYYGDMSVTLLIVILIATLLVFMTYYIIEVEWSLNFTETVWIVISSIVLVLSDLLVLWVNIGINKRNAENERMKVQLEKEKSDAKFYKLEYEKNESLEILRHDMNNHLNTILAMGNNQTMKEKPKFTILYTEEAMSFLQSLDSKVQDKIAFNINKCRFYTDKELFKKLENSEIWEFRTLYNKKAYRLFAFWDKDKEAFVVATHGIVKKTQKTPLKEILKAEEIRKEYFNNK